MVLFYFQLDLVYFETVVWFGIVNLCTVISLIHDNDFVIMYLDMFLCCNSVQRRRSRTLVKFSIMLRKPYFTPLLRCICRKKKNLLPSVNWLSSGYLRYGDLTLPICCVSGRGNVRVVISEGQLSEGGDVSLQLRKVFA